MGAFLSQQVQRRKSLSTENKLLVDLERTGGCEFPGSDYRPSDRKNWMSGLGPEKLRINQVVWPGTHDSATNKIGVPFISRPFGRCQSLSIYQQLVAGARALDIRVQEDRRICHGVLLSYSVDIVLDDLKKFLSETQSEIVILEIRTEFGHKDPADFDKYLEEKLGEHLIRQDERVKKVFVETNHGGDSHLVTSASPGSDDIAGPCCEWSGDCKKSNSTGFSKLWRFKDFVGRSSSDGKDAFVFLNKSHAPPRQMLPGTARRGKTAPLSAHAVYLKNKAKDGDRRRSYLPYRPELMGFFTNANVGFTRNVHPY